MTLGCDIPGKQISGSSQPRIRAGHPFNMEQTAESYISCRGQNRKTVTFTACTLTCKPLANNECSVNSMRYKHLREEHHGGPRAAESATPQCSLLPCLLHSKAMPLQNNDFIPEKLRAPDALPSLLGFAGEAIYCHLHIGVDSWLAVVHLGLC